VEGLRRDAWAALQAGGGAGATHGGRRRWTAAAQRSRAGKQAGEEDEDYFAISKSSRGQTVNKQ